MINANPAPPTVARPRRSRFWKWVRNGILLVLMLASLVAGYLLWSSYSANARWHRIVSELDETEPGWRFEDLEATRRIIPDERNSALLVLRIDKSTPLNQKLQDQLERALSGIVLLNRQLDDKQRTLLREEMKLLQPCLAEAEKLKDLDNGYFPSQRKSDGEIDFDGFLAAYRVCKFLKYDAMWRAEERDPRGAVNSCRALLNCGRASGDSPAWMALTARLTCRAAAVRTLEWVLAQGQPSTEDLLASQRLLEDEEAQPIYLTACRGQRAVIHKFMNELHDGARKFTDLLATSLPSVPKIGGLNVRDVEVRFRYGSLDENHLAALLYYKHILEIAQEPLEKHESRIQQLEKSLLHLPWILRWLAPQWRDLAAFYRRSQADIRCTICSLAAERYRLSHGKWPNALDDLVPDFLAKLYADPFDGNPLRFRKIKDGVIVYAVGTDRKDNDGLIDRKNPDSPGTNLGFQLWDASERRKPAATKK